VDTSANGQGAVGNMYIVDGLDVTSSIRAGVLNLTPSPDSIHETSIQTTTVSIFNESAHPRPLPSPSAPKMTPPTGKPHTARQMA